MLPVGQQAYFPGRKQPNHTNLVHTQLCSSSLSYNITRDAPKDYIAPTRETAVPLPDNCVNPQMTTKHLDLLLYLLFYSLFFSESIYEKEFSNNKHQVMHTRDKGCRRSLSCPCAGGWCGCRPMDAAALHLPAQPEVGTLAALHSTNQGPCTSRCCSGRNQQILGTHSRAVMPFSPCDGWACKGFVKEMPHCWCCSSRLVKVWLLQKQDFSNLLCLYSPNKRYWATPTSCEVTFEYNAILNFVKPV